jgi:hypothetical protein
VVDRVQKAQARHPRIELFLKIVLVAAIVHGHGAGTRAGPETVEASQCDLCRRSSRPEYPGALVAAATLLTAIPTTSSSTVISLSGHASGDKRGHRTHQL